MEDTKVESYVGGELLLWLEANGSICLKVTNRHNDPVDLSEDEAEEIALALVRLVKQSCARIYIKP